MIIILIKREQIIFPQTSNLIICNKNKRKKKQNLEIGYLHFYITQRELLHNEKKKKKKSAIQVWEVLNG